MGTYISSFFDPPKPIIFSDHQPTQPKPCGFCDKDVKTDDDAVAHDGIHHMHKKCHEIWEKNNSVGPCPTCAANEASAAYLGNFVISVPTAIVSTGYLFSTYGALSFGTALAGANVGLFLAPMMGNLFGALGRQLVSRTPTRNLKSHAITAISTFCTAYCLGSCVINAKLKG